MSIHRAKLAEAQNRREKVSRETIEAFLKGDTDLPGALELNERELEGLRRQAHALAQRGEHEAATKVFEALFLLTDPEFDDLDAVTECYERIGNADRADYYGCLVHAWLKEIDYQIWLARQEANS